MKYKGQFLRQQKDVEGAVQAFNNFLSAGQDIGNTELEKEANEELYLTYKMIGKHKQALQFLESFKALEDSVQRAQQLENIAALQSKYDLSEKERVIAEMEQDKKLQDALVMQQESDLQMRQAYVIGLILLVLLVTLFSYGLFRRFTKPLHISNLILIKMADHEMKEMLQKPLTLEDNEYETPGKKG